MYSSIQTFWKFRYVILSPIRQPQTSYPSFPSDWLGIGKRQIVMLYWLGWQCGRRGLHETFIQVIFFFYPKLHNRERPYIPLLMGSVRGGWPIPSSHWNIWLRYNENEAFYEAQISELCLRFFDTPEILSDRTKLALIYFIM